MHAFELLITLKVHVFVFVIIMLLFKLFTKICHLFFKHTKLCKSWNRLPDFIIFLFFPKKSFTFLDSDIVLKGCSNRLDRKILHLNIFDSVLFRIIQLEPLLNETNQQCKQERAINDRSDCKAPAHMSCGNNVSISYTCHADDDVPYCTSKVPEIIVRWVKH